MLRRVQRTHMRSRSAAAEVATWDAKRSGAGARAVWVAAQARASVETHVVGLGRRSASAGSRRTQRVEPSYDRPGVRTSYSRRRDDYAYDVEVHDVTRPVDADHHFCAQAINIVRLESGQTVSVNAGLQDAYGATRDEAFSKIEAAVEAWVKAQTRST
jgi:hypothetical protein